MYLIRFFFISQLLWLSMLLYSAEAIEQKSSILSKAIEARINEAYSHKMRLREDEKFFSDIKKEIHQIREQYKTLQSDRHNPDVKKKDVTKATRDLKKINKAYDKVEALFFSKKKQISYLFFHIFADLDTENHFDLACVMLSEAAILVCDSEPVYAASLYEKLATVCLKAEDFDEALKNLYLALNLYQKGDLQQEAAGCREQIISILIEDMEEICFSDLGRTLKEQANFFWKSLELLKARKVQSLFFCSILSYLYDNAFEKVEENLAYIIPSQSAEAKFLSSLLELCRHNRKEELVKLVRSYSCEEPFKREKEVLLDCFENYDYPS